MEKKMGNLFTKIMGHVCVVLTLLIAPAVAGHFFSIKKPDITWDENELTKVIITKKTNTYQIAKDPKSLFEKVISGNSQAQRKFKLIIDLQDIYSDSLMNITIILSKLGVDNTSPQPTSGVPRNFVPLLIIENGTSYKFNKIFSGISDFFAHTPKAEIRYSHTGIQFPCAAQKGLGTLSAMCHLKSHPKAPADPLQQLTDKIAELTLDNQPTSSLTPKFSETISNKNQETTIQEQNTESPAEMLQRVIKYEEVDRLKERWENFSEKWPPLGVTKAEQITKIYIDDFDELSTTVGRTPLVVLEVSGLLNDDNQAKKLIDFCWKTPSIRCVRIQDSLCTLSNLAGFFEVKNDKEGREIALLDESRIRFLDIKTALDAETRPTDLPQYFKNRKQMSFLNFLIWESPSSSVSESFSQELQNNHLLFGVFLEYLMLLQSEDYLKLLQ